MGDMNGFPSIGTPVLRRPSGEVALNKFRKFRAAGQIDSDAGIERTLHETVFTGMATSTFTSGQVVTLSDGFTYGIGIPTGGSVAITTSGLKHQHPSTSTETSCVITPANNGGYSVFHHVLGPGRLRRGRWGLWCRVSEYAMVASAWHYLLIWGTAYPNSYGGLRRARNQQGAPNNDTGSLVAWIGSGGTDSYGILGASSESSSTTNNAHNAAEDCACIYFHNSTLWDIYYGSWSNGWPSLDNMTFGLRVNTMPTRNDMDDALYMRDPKIWNLGCGGGGYSSNTGNTLTLDRWRITVWE